MKYKLVVTKRPRDVWYSPGNVASNTGWGESRFPVVSTRSMECILVLLCISYCIIFHRNNCKPTLAPPHTVITSCDARRVREILGVTV